MFNLLKNSQNDINFPNIPRRLTIQSCAALILLLSGIAIVFCALFLPPAGIIDTSVIIVFGQILIAVGTLIGVDMSYMSKIYIALLNSKSQDEKVSNKTGSATSKPRKPYKKSESVL